MRRRTTILLVALPAALSYTACGGDDPVVVSGTGYEYTLPEGWRDASAEQKFADSAAVKDSPGTDVRVSVLPVAEGLTLAESVRGGIRDVRREIENQRSSDIRFKAPSRPRATELEGERALQFEYKLAIGDGPSRTVRHVKAYHLGTSYTLTFSFARSPERDEISEMLDSWRWREPKRG